MPEDELLPTPLIERLVGVVDGDRVPIRNGSEARWARDASGRLWVRKREADTGIEPLLAEAVAWLLGGVLRVRQPHGAVFRDDEGWSWMSEALPAVGEHWEPDMRDFVENPEEVARMLVLDVLTLNEDRHKQNILVQYLGDEAHLRLWAIDSGNALIGYARDYAARRRDVPDPRNHARGLPFAVLEDHALLAAAEAAALGADTLGAFVQEACVLAGEPESDLITEGLAARCGDAPNLVGEYLGRLGALQ